MSNEEEIKKLNDHLHLHPEDCIARLKLGGMLMLAGQIDHAIYNLGIASKNETTKTSALTNLGECYRKKNQIETSVLCLLEAVRSMNGFDRKSTPIKQLLY